MIYSDDYETELEDEFDPTDGITMEMLDHYDDEEDEENFRAQMEEIFWDIVGRLEEENPEMLRRILPREYKWIINPDLIQW